MDPVPRNVATTGLGIRVTRPARAGQPNRIRVERVVERAAKATFTRTTFAAPGHLGKRLLGKERLLACTRATEAGFPGQTRSMRSGTNQPRRQSDREKRITKSAGSRFELVETAHKSALMEALLSFGIPAGLPPDFAHLAISIDEAATTLDAALRAKKTRRVHLAPLDLAVKLPQFSFGPVKLCSPKPNELSELLDLRRLKRRFRHDQEFGAAELSRFQWLIVEEFRIIDRAPGYRSDPILRLIGNDGFRPGEVRETLERIEPHKSCYPKAFEDALFFLLLLPWEDWTSRNVTWRGFSIPWVHTVDNDIFSPPRLPPSPDTLTWEEAIARDEHGGEVWVNLPVRPGSLDERATSCLTSLTSDHWSRVLTARESTLFETPIAHFLVRGFDTDGIDEFLAHITTIEAALGHIDDRSRRGTTWCVRQRVENLLDDKRSGEKFKSLFDIRCDFVHGRSGMKDISSKDRRAARRMARRVANALIKRANCTKGESREDCLNELLSRTE